MTRPDVLFSELYAQAVAAVGSLAGVDAVNALIGSGLLSVDEVWSTFDNQPGEDIQTVTYGRSVRYVTPWALPDPPEVVVDP